MEVRATDRSRIVLEILAERKVRAGGHDGKVGTPNSKEGSRSSKSAERPARLIVPWLKWRMFAGSLAVEIVQKETAQGSEGAFVRVPDPFQCGRPRHVC